MMTTEKLNIEAERVRFIAYREKERGRKLRMNSEFGGPHEFNLSVDRHCFDTWLAAKQDAKEQSK